MARRWIRFWFDTVDPVTLAVCRIGYGALVIAWALTLLPDLGAFFSRDGIAPPGGQWWEWTVLALGRSDLLIGGLFVALLAGAGALLVGWHSRIAAVLVFVALTSFTRANPDVFNAGDALMRLLAFYLMLAPAGAEWSLDRRRAGGPAPGVPAWSLRLMQIQLSVMYAGAAAAKLRGEMWRDGTAAAYALRLPDLTRTGAGDALAHSRLTAEVATYGTLVLEGGLAALIWYRRTRWIALAAGMLFHLSIELSLRIGFFSLAVLTLYPSFADPAWVRAVAARAARLSPSGRRRARRAPSPARGGAAPAGSPR